METTAEVHFAQKLASNEKKLRDRAIKKLRKYIAAKSSVGFTEDDYLKIWKGLHYCMWMQDKPVIQEELSVNITRLVHVLKSHKQALLFIKVFFKTEAREWAGIDFWRIDKFMMFVRDMLNESFVYLRNINWDATVVNQFVSVVHGTLLDSANDDIPDGIRIHVADVYLAELSKVGADQLSSSQIVDFLAPFITYIQRSKKIHIVNRVISGVFYPIISQTIERIKKEKQKEDKIKEKMTENSETNEVENDEEDDDSDDGDDELKGKIKLHLKYNCHEIADKLFEAGSNPDCSSHNRKLIYRLVKRLRNAADGVLPRLPQDVGDTKVELKEINRAVQALQTMEMRFLKKNEKSKKKKKKVQNKDGQKPVIVNGEADEIERLPNGKRKQKSAYETLHPQTKKAKTEEQSQNSTMTSKPVSTENSQKGDKKKKQKKKKNIFNNKGDKLIDDKEAEIVLGNKNEKNDNKGMKSDADSTEEVAKIDTNSTLNEINGISVINKGRKKKKSQDGSVTKTGESSSDSEVKTDKDINGSTVKSSKIKNKNTVLEDDDISTNSEANLKSDAQELSPDSVVDNNVKLSVKKKKKSLSQNTASSSEQKTETSVAYQGEDEKDVMSSKKKKKQKEEPLLDKKSEKNDADSITGLDDSFSVEIRNKKKKKKKKSLPDFTVNSDSNCKKNKNDTSVFESENKNEDVLPDSTIDSEEPQVESEKCTKIKEKTNKAGCEEESAEPNIVRNLTDDFMKVMENGEIEIFVPSKKWAKKRKSSLMGLENKEKTTLLVSPELKSEENINLTLSGSPEFENEEKTTLSGSPEFENEESKTASMTPKSVKMKKSILTPKSVTEVKTTLSETPKSVKRKKSILTPKSVTEVKTTLSETPKSVKEGKITLSGTPKSVMKGKTTLSETPKTGKEGKTGASGTLKSTKKGKTTLLGTPKSVKQGKITVSGTPFAKFEKVNQTPVAFVRKASTPRTEPRKRKLEAGSEAPGDFSSLCKKRVSFDPSRNQSRDIKDSLKEISDAAFQPDKTPTQGILKSPVVTSNGKKSKKPSKKVVLKNTICNSRTSFTPISQNRMLTRARAADFF